MLEAQMEAAKTYESWAATLPPNNAWKAYKLALEGARPGKDKENTIWGWIVISNKTSKLISRNENFKEKFFESLYHVALCRFQMGKVGKRKSDTQRAIQVIRKAATLYPNLGGPERRAEYDALMRAAQRAVGEKPVGI
jgi:predicted RNase H-like nuclease